MKMMKTTMIKLDKDAWERGHTDGKANNNACPFSDSLKSLSWSSGFIEGKAEAEQRKKAIREHLMIEGEANPFDEPDTQEKGECRHTPLSSKINPNTDKGN